MKRNPCGTAAVAALILAITQQAGAQTNLLRNPGFELGGGFSFTDWTSSGAGTFEYLQNETPGIDCHTGDQAGGIRLPSSFGSGWKNLTYAPVAPGQKLRVAAWVRTTGFDADDFVAIDLEQFNASTQSIGFIRGTGLAGNAGWSEIWIEPTITNQATAFVRAYFLLGDNGTDTGCRAVFDDVSLTVISSPLTLGIAWSNATPWLSVSGGISNRFVLEYLPALSASNHWQSLSTNTIASNPFVLPDATAAGTPKRFYRARLLP